MANRLPYKAGSITLDINGGIGIYTNMPKMTWSYRKADKIYSGIRPGETLIEDA